MDQESTKPQTAVERRADLKKSSDVRGDVEHFSASDGWLSRFKQRHSLVFGSVGGERASVDQDTRRNWRDGKLEDYVRQYSPDDIFNADETALYWKLLSDKTLTFKGDDCAGGKRSKD